MLIFIRILFVKGICVSVLAACGGSSNDQSEQTEIQTLIPTTLELKSNSQLMIANGKQSAELFVEVKDANGNALLEGQYEVTFHNGSENFTEKDFATVIDKEHVIYARSGNIESNSVEIIARKHKNYEIVEIPIIFHVASYNGKLLSGNTEYNFDSNQLQNAVDNLNSYFSNQTNSKNVNAVDTGIRFRLAKYAPDGSMLDEAGIHRIEVAEYDDGRLADTQYPSLSDIPNDKQFGSLEIRKIANDHHWDPSQYKNVIIIDSQDASWAEYYPMPVDGMLAGQHTYSEFFSGDTQDTYTDLLVIRPEGVNSWVFAHEMGHAFNLGHVFAYNQDCSDADHSPDTYSYVRSEQNSICEDKSLGMNRLHANSSQYHHDNIMDYSGSTNTFTYDQRERMRFAIENAMWLNELIYSTK